MCTPKNISLVYTWKIFLCLFFISLLSYLFSISEEAKSVLGESQSLHLYSFLNEIFQAEALLPSVFKMHAPLHNWYYIGLFLNASIESVFYCINKLQDLYLS